MRTVRIAGSGRTVTYARPRWRASNARRIAEIVKARTYSAGAMCTFTDVALSRNAAYSPNKTGRRRDIRARRPPTFARGSERRANPPGLGSRYYCAVGFYLTQVAKKRRGIRGAPELASEMPLDMAQTPLDIP